MRRKAGALIPLEVSILEAIHDLRRSGIDEAHGFLIAKEVKAQQDTRLLTAHGTLYRALNRLNTRGLLESRWEDPAIAAAEERPRRRLYRITALGETALVEALRAKATAVLRLGNELAPQ